MMEQEKLDLIINELGALKKGQKETQEQLIQINSKVDGNTKKLDSHTGILNKHTEQLDSHTGILNKHTEQLDSHTGILNKHTEQLDSHTGILNKHTAQLDSHTGILNKHTAQLDSHTGILNKHTAQLDSHTGILNKHTAQLDSHTGILNKHTEQLKDQAHKLTDLGENVDDIKNRISRSETEGPNDILTILRIIEEKVAPISRIEKQLDSIEKTVGRIEVQNKERKAETKTLNERVFRLESSFENL